MIVSIEQKQDAQRRECIKYCIEIRCPETTGPAGENIKGKSLENVCTKMITQDGLGNRGTIKKPKNENLDESLYI